MPTETRIYIGQTGSQAFDGFQGLRLGRPHPVRFLDNGQVEVTLVSGATTLLTAEEVEQWFTRG